ncbi:MAG TPA: isochorismatase family cysteine hydrolase [Baekduia sp.]|nr:isochorismatase family cysteine hydrolase [Baekduia sp.]
MTDLAPPPIPTSETALLLIDLQNGFVHPEGWTARMFGGLAPSLAATVAPAARALAAAREAGIPVIHTQHAWEPGYADGGFLVEEIYPKLFADRPAEGRFDLVRGSWDADFLAELAPREGEHIIYKNRYDAFIGTALERLLMRLKVRTLVVGGVVTTVCVESTVRDAAMRDYRVYLIGDAIGDADQAAHEDGLARLSRMFGHLVSSGDVAGAWAPAAVA